MTLALSNQEQLGYAAESAWGTIPAANPLKLLRYTNNSFKRDTTSVASNEIDTNRQVTDFIRTQVKGGGSFSFELSYGLLDDLLEGLYGGTWTANVLQVGETKKSFTIERQFTDITQFETYAGAIPTALAINVGIGRVIDGSMTFVSKAPINAATTALTGTTAAPTNSVMNPIDHIQLVQEGGGGSVSGVVGFTMNLGQQSVEFPQLANINVADIQLGRVEASGTLDVYWQDATYLTKVNAWTTTSLAFTLGGSASLKYAFLFNKVKLTVADTPNGGMNQPLTTKLNWVAFKDATYTVSQITRTP